MIGSTRLVRVHVYTTPVDMRRGFDTLAALVRQGLGRDVMSGDAYLFVGKTRRRAKVLHWDGTGLCLFAKRLSQGRFAAPWERKGSGAITWTMSELALFIEGSELVGRIRLSPSEWVPERAAVPIKKNDVGRSIG